MITIDLNDLKSGLLCLLIIACIILAIYLIVAVYNLIKTLKQSQKALDDLEVVARVASERTKQLDKLIDQAGKKIKTGQGIFNSIPVIFDAISKIAKVIGRQNSKTGKSTEEGNKQSKS